jgi:C-terminal processing protease CtpA/Prc
LGRVYVLTGDYTQGAAEWIIHSLQYSMGEDNVVVIGEKTAGQDVMTQGVGVKYHVHLFPVVAYVADGGGNHDFGKITPTIEIDEQDYISLGEYGTLDDILFNTAVRHMLGLISQNDGELEEDSDNLAE